MSRQINQTEAELLKATVVDVEETGKYYLDKHKNICKEVIHVINTGSQRIRKCVFKKTNSELVMDLGMFERNESNMKLIPSEIVERMHII